MKIGAMLPIVDKNTKEAFSKLDVAGYNYGLYRYKGDLKKYPDRFICGTETFISDAANFITYGKITLVLSATSFGRGWTIWLCRYRRDALSGKERLSPR